MTVFFIILICAVLIFIGWVLLISFKMSDGLSRPTYKTYDLTINRAKNEEQSYGELDSYEKEPFDVTMRDGYEIHGDIYPLDPHKVVVISHGHGDNKFTGIRFLQVFRDLGYTTVIYDLRGHGHNRHFACTMGLNESRDLMEVLNAVKKRFPNAVIGLFGLSMGCATTVTALKYKPEVDFVVADCGYGILKELCLDELKKIKTPAWMLHPIDWCNRLRFGYSLYNVNPIDSLIDNQIPICFIHGTGDALISYHQSEWMYDLNKGERKELHLIPDTPHAQAWNHDPAEYERIIAQFLEKYVK